ncbi:hypothetical protein M407DRAFT_27684 [Tulasnella calospora MUT 4182]|uniref:Retrotransposon gag domain-containing protein n=1 Tax=Tulasnella calospora MUT 4182 TaxID=1051891 RepID=A0A0C3QDG5_9AGAM|nr:hypothetical protein M407DRAFT_27684 [Tulasnella calospora MUT 4182]
MSNNVTGPDHLEFQGKDLKECERFISSINKHAREEGKLRDDQWIADLVAICLTGDALIWWSLLDAETQGSWRLLRQAMISRFRPLFYGKSGSEAEDFVYQIRQRALHMGKLKDPYWTAEFASGCFVGSALRWYASLESGIRDDWGSLQQAIFVQYGRGFEEDSPVALIPTPALAAAAPGATGGRRRGRIRISSKDDPKIYYISKVICTDSSNSGRVIATAAVSEALEVEFEPLNGVDAPQTLFIPDNQIKGYDALGMKWHVANTTSASRLVGEAYCI